MYARGPIEVCIAKYWRQQDRMQTAWNEWKYFSKVISGVCRDPRSPLRSRVSTQHSIVFLFRHSPFLWQSPFLCKTCRGDIHTWTINYPDTIWKTSIWLEFPIISSIQDTKVYFFASHASDQWLTIHNLEWVRPTVLHFPPCLVHWWTDSFQSTCLKSQFHHQKSCFSPYEDLIGASNYIRQKTDTVSLCLM